MLDARLPEDLVRMFFKTVELEVNYSYAVLPYISDLTEPLKKLLKRYDVKTSTKLLPNFLLISLSLSDNIPFFLRCRKLYPLSLSIRDTVRRLHVVESKAQSTIKDLTDIFGSRNLFVLSDRINVRTFRVSSFLGRPVLLRITSVCVLSIASLHILWLEDFDILHNFAISLYDACDFVRK